MGWSTDQVTLVVSQARADPRFTPRSNVLRMCERAGQIGGPSLILNNSLDQMKVNPQRDPMF